MALFHWLPFLSGTRRKEQEQGGERSLKNDGPIGDRQGVRRALLPDLPDEPGCTGRLICKQWIRLGRLA